MNKGDKVLCIGAHSNWKKNCKSAPKVGWIYLIKAVAAFDRDAKIAISGDRLGIALEGVQSKRNQQEQFFPANCFRLLVATHSQPQSIKNRHPNGN